MPQARNIYLLDPKKLSPETIAVTFAKTSRSPLTFQKIADELTDEKSADFHEKWVVGYGHSSVAEHAVLHIAVENLSRLAVECLESNRLASYTEKSSRYQIWDDDHYFTPNEIIGSHLEKEYHQIQHTLFSNYQNAVEKVTAFLLASKTRPENESQKWFEQNIRTCSADVCRYYLPSSALANVGVTINARALEHALIKLLSHNLSEVREIGREIKEVAQVHVPTLVKYAEENAYLRHLIHNYGQAARLHHYTPFPEEDWFKYIDCNGHDENEILAALLFRFGQTSFSEAIQKIQSMNEPQKKEIAEDLLGRLGEFDTPIRELEFSTIRLEVVLDQGAYFELKRHRMMSQTPQSLTTHLGYAVPRMVTLAGFEQPFCEAMHTAQQAYERLADVSPCLAAYVVPNAFNRRVLIHTNLRSAYHLINLRTAENAHFAIRRAAQRIAEELRSHLPLFAQSLNPNPAESWQSLQEQFFTRVR